jgi:hypothetical protein
MTPPHGKSTIGARLGGLPVYVGKRLSWLADEEPLQQINTEFHAAVALGYGLDTFRHDKYFQIQAQNR